MTGKNDFDLEAIQREAAERNKRMEDIELEGIKNTLKHFDRIHDNLFNFNNILIAGYFALAQIDKTVSVKTIIIPLINMLVLIWIEYRMMEKSRIESNITRASMLDVKKFGKAIDKTNKYSLLTIISTLLVCLVFLYYLL